MSELMDDVGYTQLLNWFVIGDVRFPSKVQSLPVLFSCSSIFARLIFKLALKVLCISCLLCKMTSKDEMIKWPSTLFSKGSGGPTWKASNWDIFIDEWKKEVCQNYTRCIYLYYVGDHLENYQGKLPSYSCPF